MRWCRSPTRAAVEVADAVDPDLLVGSNDRNLWMALGGVT
jgi:hypothetical protein